MRTVVTGADATYARSLAQLLASLERIERRLSRRRAAEHVGVCAIDLGMSACQLDSMRRRFPWVEIRRRDLSREAAFVRIRPRAQNTLAWKPAVIEETLQVHGGSVLWLDSACVVTDSLAPVFEHIEHRGLYVPFGGTATVRERTHPAAALHFGLPLTDLEGRMRGAGVFGASASSPVAMDVVSRWAAACGEEHVICPRGATHGNHRFDQSVLNLVLRERAVEASVLTEDALDISSPRPVRWLRTRNKVHSRIPFAADPLVRALYASYRLVDVALWRKKTLHSAVT